MNRHWFEVKQTQSPLNKILCGSSKLIQVLGQSEMMIAG